MYFPSLSTLILGCSILKQAVAQDSFTSPDGYYSKGSSPSNPYPSPSPPSGGNLGICPVGTGVQCKSCGPGSDNWKSDCNLQVRIELISCSIFISIFHNTRPTHLTIFSSLRRFPLLVPFKKTAGQFLAFLKVMGLETTLQSLAGF